MKSSKNLKFALPDKENLDSISTADMLTSQRSYKVLAFTERTIKPNQDNVLDQPEE